MPWYFPFQALSGGSQTSNLMSEFGGRLEHAFDATKRFVHRHRCRRILSRNIERRSDACRGGYRGVPEILARQTLAICRRCAADAESKSAADDCRPSGCPLGDHFDMFRSRVAFIELFATESRTAHHHRRDGGRKRGMRAYRNGVLSMTKMRTAADRLRTRRRPGHGGSSRMIFSMLPQR